MVLCNCGCRLPIIDPSLQPSVSERQGDLDNTFTADSYLTLNAALFYKKDDWRFGLAFKNIGDTKE
jgi:outer membrane receptor protein involved in Fe transport